jgi:hypothetical protein
MTTPFDRPFSETTDDDRLMTDADRAAFYREAMDRETDDDVLARTADFRDGDRTADLREDDRTTDQGEGEANLSGSEASAGLTTGTATAGYQGYSSDEPLVAEDAAVDLRSRWQVIQEGFVDDPRNAVTEADRLVDELLKRLSDTFDQQHHNLEQQWSDGEPSTEDLRRALQRYRAFFQRLLTI